MIRPRKKGYQDLPPNLYWHKTLVQFYYKHPITRKITYLKCDRETAINTAHICNGQLIQKVDRVDAILGSAMTMAKWCEHFENVILPKKKLAANTMRDYKNQLKRIRLHFKDADIGTMSVLDVSGFLDTLAETAPVLSNRSRSLMIMLFKHAIAKGYCENNLAEQTMVTTVEKQRKRLTLEQFNAMLKFIKEDSRVDEKTRKWLNIAMRLAFVTLQREGDIVRMRYDHIVDGQFRVRQEKTKKQIEIELFPELEKIIADSRDSVLSPYIVHRDPVKNIAFKGRDHYTQCSAEYLSKGFAKIRDLLPEFKNMQDAEKPTFHEIRATAIKWYEDQGIDVQFLAGHESRKMTEHYKKGHDDWQKVKVSGIKFEF